MLSPSTSRHATGKAASGRLLDDPAGGECFELITRNAQCRQHLIRVLAQHRRRPKVDVAAAIKTDGPVHRFHRAGGRMIELINRSGGGPADRPPARRSSDARRRTARRARIVFPATRRGAVARKWRKKLGGNLTFLASNARQGSCGPGSAPANPAVRSRRRARARISRDDICRAMRLPSLHVRI